MLFEAKLVSDTIPRKRIQNFSSVQFVLYNPELKYQGNQKGKTNQSSIPF